MLILPMRDRLLKTFHYEKIWREVVWTFPRSLSSAVKMRTRRLRSSTLSFPRLCPTHSSLDEPAKISNPGCLYFSEGENCQGSSRTKVIKVGFSPWSTIHFISHLFHFLSVHKNISEPKRQFRAWCIKCWSWAGCRALACELKTSSPRAARDEQWDLGEKVN